jgi:membrane-associated HD superfamily phosphohydrolase
MRAAIYCCEVIAGLALGGLSVLVFEFYSRLIHRTSNHWVQLAIYLTVAIPFIIAAPIAACFYLIAIGPLPTDKTIRAAWTLLVFLSWATVLWMYIIRHRGTLRHRLHGTRSI